MEMYNPPHPGEVLKELYFEPLGITVKEFADMLNTTRQAVSLVLHQKTGISPEMALKLSKVFSTSPELWVDMQTGYELWHAKKKVDLSRVRVAQYNQLQA